MALPILAALGLAAPLIGGALSIVGGGLGLTGAILGTGTAVASGVAGAAGGMLGGGGSGNVARDDDGDSGFERVSLGASPFGGGATGRVSGGAGLPAVVPQTSLVASDTISDGGSSPQEILMSIFKSIQSSLMSIDNTLKQMLGIEGAQLATDQKDSARGNLDKSDADPVPPTKPPGFLSKIGSGVKGLAQRNSTLLKSLGLAGLIIAFSKYRTQITKFVEEMLTYFKDVYNIFQEDGLGAALTKIGEDTAKIFNETILPAVYQGMNDLLKTMVHALQDFFNIKRTEFDPVSSEVQESTGGFGFNTINEMVQKSDTTKFNDAKSEIDATSVNAESSDSELEARIKEFKELTKSTKGKITWSVDLDDKSISLFDRANATPYVDGKQTTLEEITPELLATVNPTNFEDLESYLTGSFPTEVGSYKTLTDNENTLRLAEDALREARKIRLLDDDRTDFAYKTNTLASTILSSPLLATSAALQIVDGPLQALSLGLVSAEGIGAALGLGQDVSRRDTLKSISNQLGIDTSNVNFKDEDSASFLQLENKLMKIINEQIAIQEANKNKTNGVVVMSEGNKIDNSTVNSASVVSDFSTDSTSKEYVDSVRFVGGR
tara:strand:- start:23 stop:1846 length:1824 start_codon:yes stop_codon:yes gene_type:complete